MIIIIVTVIVMIIKIIYCNNSNNSNSNDNYKSISNSNSIISTTAVIFVNFFTPFIRVLRVCVPISNVYDFIKLQINAQCVFVFSSHSFWASSSLDVPAGVTQQEEGHTGFFIHHPSAVRALNFLARRIQPFLSLVNREVEFCVQTI